MSGSEVLGAVLGAEIGGWEAVVRVAGCWLLLREGEKGEKGRGGEGEMGRVVVTLTQWISFFSFLFLANRKG